MPNFTSLTTKLSYSSFFSACCTDFKEVIFENMHWASSEGSEVKRSFSRSSRPNFGFHLVLTRFHLEFLSFWISRLFDLGDLSVLKNGSLKYFENGLKSTQTFQRLMGGMNCWGRSHLNQIRSAVRSEIFRYGRSIFCRPNFSDIFELCLHWVSIVRGLDYSSKTSLV